MWICLGEWKRLFIVFSCRYNSIYIALQLWFYVYKSDDEGRR